MSRAAIEKRLTDDCVITREPTGPGTLDTVTKQVTKVPIAVYSGKCGAGSRLSGQRRDQGGQDVRELVIMLRLPISEPTSANVRVDDEVEFTSGQFAGETFQVIGYMSSTWGITRRFRCRALKQEVSGA